MVDTYIELIDDDTEGELSSVPPWKIAIIDDEHVMHEATCFALSGVEVLGRPLSFVSAYSAQEGKQLLIENPDIAVVLLDVVMESDDAGLKLVAEIRQELNNHVIQIVLRTGQPGYAPEEQIIQKFEINDYKTKNELTRSKLLTSVSTAIRSYSQLTTLENSKAGLEGIIKSSENLFKERSIEKFSQAVLLQINLLFSMDAQGMFCVSHQPAVRQLHWQSHQKQGYFVVATTNKFNKYYGYDISKQNNKDNSETELVMKVLNNKQHIFTSNLTCFYLSTPSGWEGAIIFDKPVLVENINQDLLTIFCVNAALGLENAKFYTHLSDAAFKDKLTGLLSRTGLIESIPINIEYNNCYLQVVDIDYFRDITENLGYEYGDKVLQAFSKYLQKTFENSALISRLHADVFALLFITKTDTELDLVPRTFASKVKVSGDFLRIGTSSGCTSYKATKKLPFDIEILLRQAETAMKVAKERHRGHSQIFSNSFEKESKQRLDLLHDLRTAISNEDLFLQLQPKVNIENSQIIGYEALLRWLHPKKGMISPAEFIPLAEKAGLYFDIDIYVLKQCLIMLEQFPDIIKPVSINISAQSLCHDDLVSTFSKIIAASPADISKVEIEVTENALIRGEIAINNLEMLKIKGFTLCLDDFGSGYSSLSYLLRLPFDIIKIDRSFIVSIDQDDRSVIVLKSILEMSEKLDKQIIVEGVEKESQVELLKGLRVKFIQGFYFYKPMNVSDIVEKSIF